MRLLITTFLATVFVLTLFSSALANDFENKISFYNFPNNTIDNIMDESSRNSELPNDFVKKLQNITARQNFSIKQIDDAMNILNKNSRVKTFLVGNKLGTLKFQIVQIKDQVISLQNLTLDLEYAKNKTQIANQIKFLEEEQEKVENFIREKEKSFSLFGWLAGSI